ncbi:MAG: Fumarate hydratase class II [Methanomassiliicoccales archaeon PtaU1.Bin124]|nr:MAG: Fumarate hydratase class II [Methanomassiliicoccales archaeon PtaU1.Bin124]
MSAYAEALNRDRWRIYKCEERLRVVNLGGTAIGTGFAAQRQYIFRVVDTLRDLTGIGFARAENLVEATQNTDVFVEVSGILKANAATLLKTSSDLRLLASGPEAGLGEIRLPQRQAGSSIMPGKVNPVMAECLDMICFQVIGHDTAVMLAGQAGQLEINVMEPLITHNIIHTQELLINFLPVFTARCIVDIQANEAKCRHYLDRNPILATFLSRKIGYMQAADVVDESLRSGKGIPQIAVEKGYLTKQEADELFHPESMVRPTYERKEG